MQKSIGIAALIVLFSSDALLASSTIPKEPVAQSSSVILDSGPIPVSIDTAQFLVANVKINGADTAAIIDTGSSDVLIDESFAVEHGLRISRLVNSGAVGGSVNTGIVSDLRLEMGHAIFESIQAHTFDLTSINKAKGTSYKVIIGMSALGAGNLDMNFSDMQVSIGKGSNIKTEKVRSYPFNMVRGVPVLDIALAGKNIKAVIDTGKDTDLSVTDNEFNALTQANGLETDLASGGIGGISISRLSSLKTLSFGDYTLKDVVAQGVQSGGLNERLGADAVVGLRVLRQFNIRLDFVSKRAFLTPSHVEPPVVSRSTSGLQLVYGDTSARVVHVMAKSPAATSGWNVGDQICQVNGNVIRDVKSSPQLKAWGTDVPGKKITLTLCNGEKRDLILKKFY